MSVGYTLICVSSSRGLQQYTARLANALSATEAVRVTVVGQPQLLSLLTPTIQTVELSGHRLSLRTLWVVARTLLARRDSVLHYQGINLPTLLMFYLASMFGRRTVLTPHNVQTHFPNRIYNRIKWILWRSYNMVIVHTESERDLIPRDLQDKIAVIPHGEYAPSPGNAVPTTALVQRVAGIGPYLLAPGFIRDDKNLGLLLQNSEFLRSLGLTLVVAGRNLSRISDQEISSASIYIDGFLSDEDLTYLISHAASVVLPYDKVSESGILHQALSVGTPVVASDIPGFRERIIIGFNGLLLPSLNSVGFKVTIEHLRDRLFDREAIREHHLSTYSWDAIASQVLEALDARRLRD